MNANWNAAPVVVRTFNINKANQIITFNELAAKTYGDPGFEVTATASSGLPVTFSTLSQPVCTVNGNQVTLIAAGVCAIRASQAGNSNYNAAADVIQSFTVAKANQTISFASLSDKTYGDSPFGVSPTGGGSGNPVTLSAGGSCTVAGTTVSLTGVGSCTITASQAGNDNYNAAPSVDQSFTINHVTLIEGTHYTISCDPTPVAITSFSAAKSTCTLTALQLPGDMVIRVDSITTSLTGGATGWTVGLAKEGVAFGTLPGDSPVSEITLASGAAYTFDVVFTPTACDAATNPPAVSVILGLKPEVGAKVGELHSTTERTVAATFTAPIAQSGISNLAITDPGVLTYSMTNSPDVSGSFVFDFTVSGCGAQHVTVAMGPFSDGPKSPVPFLKSATHGATTNSSGMTLTNPPAEGASLTLSSAPTKILVGSSSSGQEKSVTHAINLLYTVPANTPVGDYTATITVTTGNGP